jgi:hypothetical protein
MKWVLIIVVYGFWDGDVTKAEIAQFSTKQECTQAKQDLLRSSNKVYLCTERSKP